MKAGQTIALEIENQAWEKQSVKKPCYLLSAGKIFSLFMVTRYKPLILFCSKIERK